MNELHKSILKDAMIEYLKEINRNFQKENFDNIELKECVLHYNCEKTYPVGRMHEGVFILRGDDKEHNGDCNPTYSIDQLVEDNNLTEVFDHYQKPSKNKRYTQYYVYGTNY